MSDPISKTSATDRARRLEKLTLGWNIAEAGVAITAGVFAGSTSLIGFGADSVIESLSALVLLLHLNDEAGRAGNERRTLGKVGVCFLILATYVVVDAGLSLLRHESPEVSLVGIGIATLSLIVMPLLARAKRRLATELGSPALAADAKQTDVCAWLSAILLTGLGLNAAFGWWWADSVAALLMTPLIVWEGVRALRGQSCCGCACAGGSSDKPASTSL